KRPAGQQMDLKGSLYSLAVTWLDSLGTDGIDACEPRMHGRPAMLCSLRIQLFAQLRIGSGQLRQPSAQCTKIKHRPAHQQRQLAAGADVIDGTQRIGNELPR